MIIECINFIDHISGNPANTSLNLEIGKKYLVLALHIRSIFQDSDVRLRCQVRIETPNRRSPVLEDFRQFKIVSGYMPPSWTITTSEHGDLLFSPIEWVRMGFWEDFFNEEQKAINEYNNARLMILEAESSCGPSTQAV
jgi:hypothetical protein